MVSCVVIGPIWANERLAWDFSLGSGNMSLSIWGLKLALKTSNRVTMCGYLRTDSLPTENKAACREKPSNEQKQCSGTFCALVLIALSPNEERPFSRLGSSALP